MESKQYVVALEISSSKIVGVLGEPNANGGVEILDIEAERSLNCVRWGCIQNVEETKMRVNRVISRLEERISPKKITGVYVGIGGRSVHNHEMNVSTIYDEERMITESVIEALRDRYYSEAEVQGDILEVVPCQYFVDNNEIANPIGAYGTSIKVRFNGVVAKSTLKLNINRALDSQYAIKGYIVTPLAMAEHVLSNEERQLGCMLVDFGAETVTVSIFRKGVLQYLATLPMGSQLITRDLTNLNVLEDAAEEIKKTSGNAIASDSGRGILVDGVKSTDVQNYVVARSEEIVANINEQISYSGLSRDQIGGGIVLVGGGSQLNGFNRLVEDKTKLKVRFGSIPANVMLHDRAARGIEYLEVISILAQATSMMKIGDSCVQEPVKVEEPIVEEKVVEEKNETEEYAETDVEKPLTMPQRKPKKQDDEDDEVRRPRRKGGDNTAAEDDYEENDSKKRVSSFSSMFQNLKIKLTKVFEESDDAYDNYDEENKRPKNT